MPQESTDSPDTQEYKRLSECWLWDFQRTYYQQLGINAWSQGTVPHYITSNPFIASAYTKIIIGFLRDSLPHLDLEHPLNIIELGAGSGRLAYHLLKQLTEALDNSSLSHVLVRYIITDLAEKNVEFCRNHPSMQPFIDRGILDFGVFDAVQDNAISLQVSGESISRKAIQNPIIVIGNYFFDSIPQDAFHVEDGQLHQTLIKAWHPELDTTDFNSQLLSEVRTSYKHIPAETAFYGDNDLDSILHYYHDNLTNSTFLFPATGIRCIRNLEELSGGRMLLISGDKGHCHQNDLEGLENPQIAFHGSLSTMVNYHAIGHYVTEHHGTAMFPPDSDSRLSVAAFLLDNSANVNTETRMAYTEVVENGNPADFFNLKTAIEARIDDLTLEQTLSYLRVSSWDSTAFMACYPRLLELLESANDNLKQQLHKAVTRVWDTYYHISERLDIAYHIGVLLSKMNQHSEALEYFQHSLDLYGPSAHTYHNMGVCLFSLGKFAQALSCVSKTKQLDPDFDESSDNPI